jgi:hypothetical protein
VATLRSPEKEALVRRFYSSEVTREERAQILQTSQATVVALGPRERDLGTLSLDGVQSLDRVYAQDGVELFRVVR